MRIFVAGATGGIGRHIVPMLISAGHSVIGSTRTPAKADSLARIGAQPVIADGLDAEALRRAVALAKPDAIIHEMTDLAGVTDLRHFDRAFAKSNDLRMRGTDNLLAAARETGVTRLIAQSFCGWPYARTGGPVKSESDELDPDPPKELRRSLDAIRHVERAVTTSTAPAGIVLRYGTFYGESTGLLDMPVLDEIRHRRMPLIGNGKGWWSFVHIEDAAAATVLAVERGTPGGIYNIVDDDPAPVSDWLPALAGMIGAKRPLHVPAWIARFLAGEHLVSMMTQARAGSNAKAKRELGWVPAHPSWRQGFAEILARRAAHKVAA